MTETTTNTGLPSSTPRWMRLALIASLAVNLAVAGLVGGAVLSHRDEGHRGRDGRESAIGVITQALSREDRRALRAGMLASRQERRAAVAEDLKALSAALRAQPFDPAAVQTVFERQIGRMSDGLRRGQDIIAARFAAMTAAERTALADRLDAAGARAPGDDD